MKIKVKDIINLLYKMTRISIEDENYNELFNGKIYTSTGEFSRIKKFFEKEVNYFYALAKNYILISIK